MPYTLVLPNQNESLPRSRKEMGEGIPMGNLVYPSQVLLEDQTMIKTNVDHRLIRESKHAGV